MGEAKNGSDRRLQNDRPTLITDLTILPTIHLDIRLRPIETKQSVIIVAVFTAIDIKAKLTVDCEQSLFSQV